MRICQRDDCEKPLGSTYREDARYCSDRCRIRAWRERNHPTVPVAVSSSVNGHLNGSAGESEGPSKPRSRPRKFYRPKVHGKRDDTEYIVFPAEVLELALGTTEAHSREEAIQEFMNGSPSPPIAIPARSVKTA